MNVSWQRIPGQDRCRSATSVWGKSWGKIAFSWPPGWLGQGLGGEVVRCAAGAGIRAIGLTVISCP